MIRTFDFILSSLAILVLLPILLPVMLILLCTGEHHVFYLQNRVGQGGQTFSVFKFATMLLNSPSLPGGFITQAGDPRVLPFGKLLRKTKINELPQLFNVWLGQMSVIGPRPVVASHFELYSPEQQEAIKGMKPGLSGLGSLFFRNEESLLRHPEHEPKWVHDHVAAPYKGALELWYARHISLYLYFKLIFLTVLAILNPSFKPLRWFREVPSPPDLLRHHWE